MTKDEFQREERYVVFKLSDVANYFYTSEISQLFRLSRTQQAQRAVNGKLPLECVVVESDWPEYEPTWKAIEARVMGAQPAPTIVGVITPAHIAQAVADGTITPAYIMQPAPSVKDAIIDDLQSQFDTEGVTEQDSGDALIRLSDAIAAVEDNFAQPAPIEQDTSVRKAWARFSNELHRSSDAPYPGMSDAFEQHFSQSFTDREWRAESATWAAAWKAAKRHEAQAQPAQKAVAYLDLGVGGYMDVGTDLTDEALAALPKGRHMLGIVGTYGVEGYVQAQPAPFIPEGWKLVPIEVIELYSFMCAAFVPMTPQQEQIALQLDLAKRAMLAVAPEAKL